MLEIPSHPAHSEEAVICQAGAQKLLAMADIMDFLRIIDNDLFARPHEMQHHIIKHFGSIDAFHQAVSGFESTTSGVAKAIETYGKDHMASPDTEIRFLLSALECSPPLEELSTLRDALKAIDASPNPAQDCHSLSHSFHAPPQILARIEGHFPDPRYLRKFARNLAPAERPDHAGSEPDGSNRKHVQRILYRQHNQKSGKDRLA